MYKILYTILLLTTVYGGPVPDSSAFDDTIIFEDNFNYNRNPWSARKPPTRRPTTTTTSAPEETFLFGNEGNEENVENVENKVTERKAALQCKSYIETKYPTVEPHILYGEEVVSGDLPQMAAIGYMKPAGLEFDCGGTLISDRFVLTAAHCILNKNGIQPTLVRLGTIKLTGTFDTSETDFAVKKEDIFVHPKYNRLKKQQDIALIRLDRAVSFTKVIYPACINTDEDDPTDALYIAGWGGTENADRSQTLLKANVSSVPLQLCNQAFTGVAFFRNHYPSGYLSSQICAKDLLNTTDTCPGDSGGPLLQPLAGAEAMYKVVGITSFGKKCGTNSPGIYTRVSSYLDWIEGLVWP